MAPRRRGLAALSLACLVGCAAAPREPERTVLDAERAEVLLVLPLNATQVMPPELEGLSPLVWQELERYLRATEKRLKTVAFADARRLWLTSIRKARAGEKGIHAGFEDAARLFVLELARHAEFDIVVVPNLYIGKASIHGRRAVWDGVTRDVELEARSFEARTLAANVPLEGAAPAASLHAMVLDAAGNKLQESRGGLELLVRVEIRAESGESGSQPVFEFATRTDLFANRENLREGIELALLPLLPPILME